ncbi:MAG: prepilin-type N-terminal cleavage/methylation domain-containing protein [Endomicrobiales bacterium]|nr:prepilin-type N-terminal cleavage/methylation domain-containing protein [Endomicrobiales bacterium]
MTLTEMMLVVAILGILGSLGSVMFIQINEFYFLNRARTDVQEDARIILGLLNRNLRQAKQSTLSIGQLAGQPPYSRITFTKQQGTTMSFYQDDNRLEMTTGGVTRTLSENLRYIAFTMPMTDDQTIISVSLTMEKETYRGKKKAMHLAVEKVRVMNL